MKFFQTNENNRLTSANFCVVFDGCWHWFKSVTIPMDGIKCNQFCPSLFLRLGLVKNSLKKTELLKINLWTPSNCKRKRWLKVLKKL